MLPWIELIFGKDDDIWLINERFETRFHGFER